MNKTELRQAYEQKLGKKPFNGWNEEKLIEKMEAYGKEPKKEPKIDYTLYRQLPPPIKEHLEREFGNWLNHFQVWKEWRQDAGGDMLFIKIPPQFSTEYKETLVDKMSNRTRRPEVNKEGDVVKQKRITEDIRCRSLMIPIDKVIQWLDLVKAKIIRNAASKALKLPSLGVPMQTGRMNLEEYEKSLHV